MAKRQEEMLSKMSMYFDMVETIGEVMAPSMLLIHDRKTEISHHLFQATKRALEQINPIE